MKITKNRKKDLFVNKSTRLVQNKGRGKFIWVVKGVSSKPEKHPKYYYQYDGMCQSSRCKGNIQNLYYKKELNRFYYKQRKNKRKIEKLRTRPKEVVQESRYRLVSVRKRTNYLEKMREKRTQEKLMRELLESVILTPDNHHQIGRDTKSRIYNMIPYTDNYPKTYFNRESFKSIQGKKVLENKVISYYLNKYIYYYCKGGGIKIYTPVRSYILKNCLRYLKPRTIRQFNKHSRYSIDKIIKFFK